MGSDGQESGSERESGARFGLLTCGFLERATRFELATLVTLCQASRSGTGADADDRFAEGSNVVVLDPDVAAEFKTRQAVNDALRAQLKNGRRASGDDG